MKIIDALKSAQIAAVYNELMDVQVHCQKMNDNDEPLFASYHSDTWFDECWFKDTVSSCVSNLETLLLRVRENEGKTLYIFPAFDDKRESSFVGLFAFNDSELINKLKSIKMEMAGISLIEHIEEMNKRVHECGAV